MAMRGGNANAGRAALESIRRERIKARQIAGYIEEDVHKAKSAGATWEQIGDALAITKQAAQQRYGHKDPWTAADTAAGLTPSMLAKP